MPLPPILCGLTTSYVAQKKFKKSLTPSPPHPRHHPPPPFSPPRHHLPLIPPQFSHLDPSEAEPPGVGLPHVGRRRSRATMLEASVVATAIPSLRSAFNNWFNPTVLFLLLNLMIDTIALTSSLTPSFPPFHLMHHITNNKKKTTNAPPPPQPPYISILDRVKSLGLFSPSKSSPQQRQPPPLIPPEEVDAEMVIALMDPFEKQGLGQTESTSPTGKFESFDLYGYLPQEPASKIPRESNPAHYIFEQTHPLEVMLPAEQDGKIEEEGEEEDGEAEEKEEEEDERVSTVS